MLNTSDKEFIVSTVTTVVSKEIQKSNTEMKQFVVEHVSNEINDFAQVMIQGFERVDQSIDKLEDNMNSKFEGINRRIDDISINRVKNESYERLEKRVTKLELKFAK